MTDPGQLSDRQSTETASVRELVKISFPANVDFVVLARFAAATIASRAGFDLDDIEDLRLAVDELCISFGAIEEHRSIALELWRVGSRIRISCTFEPLVEALGDEAGAVPEGVDWQRTDELSQQLLDALVSRHGREYADGRPCAWLEMEGGAPPA